MHSFKLALVLGLSTLLLAAKVSQAQSQATTPAPGSGIAIVQPSLTAPGSASFHLQSRITDKDDPDNPTDVEVYWVNATRWRREIKSSEFSQTLIVNGNDVFDEHSDDFIPLPIETLLTAMTDPGTLLAAMASTDKAYTKANGGANESGVVCFEPAQNGKAMTLCGKSALGLREIVDVPGHPVQFTNYQEFFGRRVAREILTTPEVGVSYTARVTFLSQLDNPDQELFSVPKPTPPREWLRIATFSEQELRGLLTAPHEVVWPQVLDGNSKGSASYYVAIDRDGKVRETVVIRSDNERANDSARRQITSWKFKPPTKDSLPVQAEGILNFRLDTRAWGPASPLNNDQVRKLASDMVEPAFPPGVAPSGSISSVMIAVDADGKVIEMIAGGGPPGVFVHCMKALQKWHFSPIIEKGQARPYRAQVDFRVP